MFEQGTDAALPYLLSRRVSAADGRRPPLLCFLHGYDEGAPTPIAEALTRHGPFNEANSESAARFIVVAPQLPSRGDLWHTRAKAVADLVRHVQALHDADPTRTYLTGFSFGGNGVFDLALQQPAIWAALWAVDPTRVPPADPQLPVWLSSGAISRRLKQQFVQRLQLRELQDDAPGERVYLDYGRDHVGTAASAYHDPRIYEWLMRHSRGTGC